MAERTIETIGMPAIEECPECGYDSLYGTTVEVNSSTIKLDGSGGIQNWNHDVLQDVLVISLECHECGEILVEDGEAVHEVVDV
jgi:hypothetical protein